ncbi:Frag1/DRAM/Sfk1 family-domain-containing protein [Suillus clintonianus]|uniref:Frag1/DRAM/Sfk1 family-domain-containing protein n=1 Tax=Suillus clintonianus TaxID=1904413 RepID=UPI001B883B3C|nr:Frag1/DRAM/Sfk1 family-domain-containing protein [Suillus clintonianus]KAG2133313.1 Frag1/DRAM/Sfk1 family-domain-containing protein [Suillus clintonianus]
MFGLHLSTQSHRLFVCVPLFTAFFWFATLLAMLLTWIISGRPQYVSQEGQVAYISDIGASFLKPLFVVSCCITGIGFMLSLMFERLLRHRGRLHPSMRKRERVFEILAILGSFIGMWGLIFLSGFDTKHYSTAHRFFLLIFALGVILSVIFTVLEYSWLAHNHPDVTKLRRAYLVKAVIGSILIVLAIAFGITLYYAPNVGGVIEWIIGFGYTFYLLTFAYDLRMAKITQQKQECYYKNTSGCSHKVPIRLWKNTACSISRYLYK